MLNQKIHSSLLEKINISSFDCEVISEVQNRLVALRQVK